MALVLAGVPSQITNLIQDRTLERMFHDALYPRLLFRAEARPESWMQNLGERQIFTRTGLIPARTAPLVPGVDPVPRTYDSEQWEAEASQHGDTIDTHMPSSYVTLASTFLRNTQNLGLNAGQTLNRLARNPLYAAYLGGEAMVDIATGGASLTLHVNTLNGFTQQLQLGRLSPVSAGNPLGVTFSTAEPDNTVVSAVPDDPAIPLGGGTLTFGVATGGATAQRVGIFALTASLRLRSGGGATVDALTAVDILTLNDVIAGVARLRAQNVPPHPDGKYHCHLNSQAEAEIFQDNHWQRLHQSLPDGLAYRDFVIGEQVGCYFYRNEENPLADNVENVVAVAGGAGGATLGVEIGGELTNANGVPIIRSIITGGGALYEKYIDESKFISEAGVTGRIGQFSIINGGVAIMTKRIRFILRSPLDRLQQVVGQTWSWSGDFPVPSDQTSGDGARFKRSVVLEHA